MKSLGLLATALLFMHSPFSVVASSNARQQQTKFGMETPRPERPVHVPDTVLAILKEDQRLERCGPEVVVTKEWFTASEIDLNGDSLMDLVVVPIEGCLVGANVGPFWVFRKALKSYQLALAVDALGIEILETKSSGTRDIAIYSATATEGLTTIFKFNGATYQPVQQLCQAIGSIRFHCVFFLARRELEQRTKVPLMLPTTLSSDYDPADPEQPHAIIEEASSDAYTVMLAWTPDCNGANVCRFGWVSGRKLNKGDRISGKKVRLAGGTTGYYEEGECFAYCNPSTMSWVKNGYLYTVADKAASEKALVRIANSAITGSW